MLISQCVCTNLFVCQVVLGADNLKDALLGQPPGGDAASAAPEGVANRRSPVLFVGNLVMLGLDCVTLLDQVHTYLV